METIKAKKVNEFVPVEDDAYYEASVAVKVKNKVYEVRMDYRKPKYDEDRYEVNIKVKKELMETFEDLGIQVDYSDLEEEYKELVKVWKEKREEKKNQERKTKYKHLWIHNAKEKFEEYDIGVKIISEEEYIENDFISSDKLLFLKHRGYSVGVRREHIGSNFKPKIRYTINNAITDYRKRMYKKESSLVEKVKELVNQYIIKQEQERAREWKSEKIVKQLEKIEIEGCETEITSTRHSWHGAGARIVFIWEQGEFGVETYDGENFICSMFNNPIQLKALKKFILFLIKISQEKAEI